MPIFSIVILSKNLISIPIIRELEKFKIFVSDFQTNQLKDFFSALPIIANG